jgi:hypothetical protein
LATAVDAVSRTLHTEEGRAEVLPSRAMSAVELAAASAVGAARAALRNCETGLCQTVLSAIDAGHALHGGDAGAAAGGTGFAEDKRKSGVVLETDEIVAGVAGGASALVSAVPAVEAKGTGHAVAHGAIGARGTGCVLACLTYADP